MQDLFRCRGQDIRRTSSVQYFDAFHCVHSEYRAYSYDAECDVSPLFNSTVQISHTVFR